MTDDLSANQPWSNSPTPWLRIVIGLSLGLFIAINFIAGFTVSEKLAEEAAIARCREDGWQATNGDVIRSEITSTRNGTGKAALITLKKQDQKQPVTIRVTLYKPINLMGWRVSDYREEKID